MIIHTLIAEITPAIYCIELTAAVKLISLCYIFLDWGWIYDENDWNER